MKSPEKRPWWSVRISGVFQLLAIVFGSLALAAIVAAGVWLISSIWITPRERRAAIVAVDRIEELRNSNGSNDDTYKVKKARAEKAVEHVASVAVTLRDKRIAGFLYGDLVMTTMDKEDSSLANS